MEKDIWPRVLVGFAISLGFALLVFFTGTSFTNPSYAFYAGAAVFVSGVLLLPLILGKAPPSSGEGR